jgi:hypothetical protein
LEKINSICRGDRTGRRAHSTPSHLLGWRGTEHIIANAVAKAT